MTLYTHNDPAALYRADICDGARGLLHFVCYVHTTTRQQKTSPVGGACNPI